MKVECTPKFKLHNNENDNMYRLEIYLVFTKDYGDGLGGISESKRIEKSFELGSLLINTIDNSTFLDVLFNRSTFDSVNIKDKSITKTEKANAYDNYKSQIESSLLRLSSCVDRVLRIDDIDIVKDSKGKHITFDISGRNILQAYKRLALLDINDLSDIEKNNIVLRNEIKTTVEYHLYILENGEKISIQNINDLDYLKKTDILFETAYSFSSIIDLLYFEFYEMVKKNVPVRKCLLCNSWFIPREKRDRLYCNRIYKGGKTCKQLGAIERYNEKTKQDEALIEFKRARDRRLKRKTEDCDNDYVTWTRNAEIKREEYLNNIITKDDFIKWLNSDRLKKKGEKNK